MSHNKAFILDFSDIRSADLPLVGGKGANLGEMAHAGFPVPPGFCLTTVAFQQFMAAAPDSERLYRLLDTVASHDVETVRRVGQQVRQSLLDVPIPTEIAEAARMSWREIGVEHAYAVRSSATAEDLPDASFAGQQDTYLNIIGEEALLDAIRRCWASLFTDRAILYRCQNNFSHRDVQLSVVVQKMIMSETSGILFTADPLTGHRHTLTIDASFGLGEALVGGLVSPDSYRVDKRTYTILDRQIADKQVAIFPEANGGTRQEALPADKRKQTVLADEAILSLTEMGCQIESYYGKPQDIEWAIADGKNYLLQSRPITSLYPIDGLTSPDDSLHIYFSMGHQQNMTRAMVPLSLSSFPKLIQVGTKPDGTSTFLRISGGRIFIDVTSALRHPILRRVISALLSQFDVLVPQAFRLAMQRPEFKRAHGLHFSLGLLKGVLNILRQVFHALWRRDLSGFVDRTNALMDEYITEITRRLRAYPRGKPQIQAVLDSMPQLFPFFLHWVPEAAAGIAATRLLPKLAGRWLPPDEVDALTLGIPGNVVNEMNLALSDLAELARRSPQLTERFEHLGNDANAWLAGVTQIKGSTPFLEAWDGFLARYGSRGPSEIDISMARWLEDPLPVLRVIAGNIEKNVSSRALFDAQSRAREAAFAELIAATRHGLLGSLRLRLFNRLYHVLIEVGGMREHHKFMAVRFLWLVKQILRENAADLVTEGRIAAREDVWFLTWQELLAIWDDSSTAWGEIVTQRRADFDRYQKMTPPVVITSDGETPVVQYRYEDAPPGALLGNPVSAGIVEGVAHVIYDPATETLQPGEILVAPFTDPGWTPLFINAAGLVMDIGGALAHGSVVAREYGIPAVVGVRESTRKIKTGQRVRVDGNRGIIEIL